VFDHLLLQRVCTQTRFRRISISKRVVFEQYLFDARSTRTAITNGYRNSTTTFSVLRSSATPVLFVSPLLDGNRNPTTTAVLLLPSTNIRIRPQLRARTIIINGTRCRRALGTRVRRLKIANTRSAVLFFFYCQNLINPTATRTCIRTRWSYRDFCRHRISRRKIIAIDHNSKHGNFRLCDTCAYTTHTYRSRRTRSHAP
jgi:hypothetical protein